MDELIPILILGLVLIPTLLSFNKTKTQQQEQQKAQKARQQAPAKPAKAAKPATVLPPREQAPVRPTLQPTLHDHSGMFDGSLYADNGADHQQLPDRHARQTRPRAQSGPGLQPAEHRFCLCPAGSPEAQVKPSSVTPDRAALVFFIKDFARPC